ncbi:uncharacterized protein B0H18DRAFT_982899 [Fomitopsis serialis]|uniref:uncharacterized protein n=1 Tax=Fomitopsis serialis TaxID=139415 RepID=UPI0020078477|nr:uncharacterized protein B0H18DRAFT_982899 [Neoantrodia serialis]KAH9933292.1 hypothetical protein B0H18DRAFT_982899 [Neoantrodia serialis]
MYTPRLPLALTDEVIGYLHDDERTLGTCALVCRGWLPVSRMYKFREFEVNHRRMAQSSCPLLCDSAPTILPYVRCLRLELYVHEIDRVALKSTWLDTLPRMRLDQFTALQCLELSRLRWEDLSRQSRDCLFAACRRIQTLILRGLKSLDGIEPALEMLFAAPLLKHFELSGVEPSSLRGREDDRTIFDHSSPFYADKKMPVTLRSVAIGAGVSFVLVALDHFTPVLQVHTLSAICLRLGEASDLAMFVQSCGASLECGTSAAAIFCETGGFSHNTSLRTLEFTLDPCESAPPMLSILQQISSSVMEKVRMVSTPQHLRTMDFDGLASILQNGPLSGARLDIDAVNRAIVPSMEANNLLPEHLGWLVAEDRLIFTHTDIASKDLPTPSTPQYEWADMVSFDSPPS